MSASRAKKMSAPRTKTTAPRAKKINAPLRVRVNLGARAYPILIGRGLIAHGGAAIAPLLARPFCAVVSDTSTAARHWAALRRSLRAHKIDAPLLTLKNGEGSKSFAGLERVCRFLLAQGVERGDYVLALGGGMVGDVAGLATALTRRGCGLVQLPTTLLAQIDSAIGGKTAINTSYGKNLVGTFYQPSLVLTDSGVLRTLPARQMRAGYAEMVKYAALGDAKFFRWLETNGGRVLAHDEAALADGIARSVRMKAKIVASDERDEGARALLNLGHSFGHGLERLAGYGRTLLHGEAVALGMQLAFDFSVAQKLCPPAAAQRLRAHLQAVGLPSAPADLPPRVSARALLSAMRQDKKNEAGALTLILVRELGEAFVAKKVNERALAQFLTRALAPPTKTRRR